MLHYRVDREIFDIEKFLHGFIVLQDVFDPLLCLLAQGLFLAFSDVNFLDYKPYCGGLGSLSGLDASIIIRGNWN